MSSSSYCLHVDGFWHDVFNVTSIAAPGPSLEPYTYELQFKILASKIYRLPLTASYRSIFSNLSIYASLSLSLSLWESDSMAGENEPAKLLLPYLQRADELQKHEPLVAYYCMSLSLSLSLSAFSI